MCLFGSHRTRRRGSHPRSEKGSMSALKRLVATSTLIMSPVGGNRRGSVINADALDGPEEQKAEFLVFLSEGIQRHLRRVYIDLKGGWSALSRERFVEFLRETQMEESQRGTAEEKQEEEGLMKMLELERYDFEQFLWAWYRNFGWRAMRRAVEKDLSKPISNYFISSSHNTYLEGNQLSSRSSADAYRSVLRKDCRCIEIDVWNGETPSTRTPSRSPHPEHRRHLSSSSLPSAAASALETMEGKYETVRHMIAGKPHHNGRSPSPNHPATFDASFAKESTTSLDPMSGAERLGRPRASSRGSKHSSCTRCEPIVMHGWTLTSPVGFREVCKAIREVAFVKNPLPIIVSLEVHADTEQQEMMVDIMKEEWEGLLLDRPHNTCDPHNRQPRLNELLNKILIKVKRPPAKAIVPTGGKLSSLAPTTTIHDDDASGSEDERVAPEHRRTKKVPICAKLSALAIYTHSEHFKSFDAPAARTPSHIFSINETRILELQAARPREMAAHNRDFFMRAYPRGMRVDSSNPDPSLYWRRGVQMVAMNWQSWDEGMMLNAGMFAGEKGWVLKPPGYLSGDGGDGGAVPVMHKTVDLFITIFAGQHIPLPEARQKADGVGAGGAHDRSFRPFIKCELHVERTEDARANGTGGGEKGATGVANGNGVAAPQPPRGAQTKVPSPVAQYKQKTKARETNYPDFGRGGVTMEFRNVPRVVEELSFVRFKVEDETRYYRDVLAAWACIRLDRLRQGYRFIELMDAKGNASDGKLFVRIEKTVR